MSRPGIGEKRFSANKFYPLLDDSSNNNNMANPNDATIDIPLTTVPSRGTGARKTNTNNLPSPTGYGNGSPNDEKPQHRPGPGRRKKTGAGESIQNGEESEGALNTMGRIYFAVLNFSVITRYFIYVSPLALLIAIPIIIGTTAAPHAAIGGVRICWFFTWIEVIWISLWVSKIVAHFLPFLFQFFAGFVSPGTKKYALILRSLEIPLSLVGWAIVSLATFIPIMTQNPTQRANNDTGEKSWQATVKQILFALLICTLIFLAEKALIRLISVSYHRKQYELRIKESKHNVELLGYLYDASRAMFPEYCKEFAEEDEIISSTILADKKKGHRRGDSVAPLRLIRNVGRNVGRVSDKVTAAFGNVAHEITGKNIFDTGSAHAIVTQALDKRHASEALAKRIWMSFVVEGRDALYEEDIVEVMGAQREEEARECFHILDRDGNGDVSMEEMILTVAEFGRVRKSIARSMHDVDQAIHVLDSLLLTVALIIMILVFVSFVTTGAATVIAAGATSLLSLSFVFATTAQEVLGSCVFLFVKHPFDVGDRVEINSQELFVEEISLLYTAFRTVAEQRVTQVANNVLNSAWIDNVTRSKAMRERISLFVDFGTTFADIQLLKIEMEKFVRDKDNNRDFQPDIEIEVISVGNMDKLELRIEIRHKSNWSNETVRAARRSKFMCALVLAIRKIPIYGPGGGGAALGDPSNPSYSVSITDEKAKEYREKAAEKKEEARLVPTSAMKELHSTLLPTVGASTGVETVTTSGGLQQRSGGSVKKLSEADFVGALNSRPVGYDLARPEETAQLYRIPSANSTHEQQALSPVQDMSDEQTSLLRAPSTGRRKESSTVPTLHQPSPLLMPPSATGAIPANSGSSITSQQSQGRTDRYEIPSYYSAAPAATTTGTTPYGAPYEANNPYAGNYGNVSPAPSTAASQYRPAPPQYQSPPASAAASNTRAGQGPAGNAFAQQQQQPRSAPLDDEDN
ncbi:serine/threonine protein kinase [Talaromyces stipitatus ATCC 10500]|uniref:Serine/threonine protein kinase n=1 Tax=Talaromyces stipitatus (strain ATCC 10500 / CBS 375.48 / QM 6759 / NRRL 1006) TaxID=441959 RepID=B8MC97_TALSN|nr:serine/threonine protein kinase [Talaromyces stipitatus ATCC 10500]EED18543.1 serine/threonine protein kinase [Talaromyces stipitatus ATCC 10500]